ncbi:MAG: putative rane protein [Massilia sp.]|nr:putative rane protein [Massilia sp.]
METQKLFHWGAMGSLVALIVWLVVWEMIVAPLHPGGSLLALKALPLLIPLRGVFKRDIYTLQWSAMVILLYFTEGVVRAWSDTLALSRTMAIGEIVLVCVYFSCALLYLRPYKRAAKKLAKELLDKVNPAKHEC